MLSKLLRYSFTAVAMLTLPVVPANAQKEQFVRSKPHVNVGSTQSVYRGNDRLRSAGPSTQAALKWSARAGSIQNRPMMKPANRGLKAQTPAGHRSAGPSNNSATKTYIGRNDGGLQQQRQQQPPQTLDSIIGGARVRF